MAQVLINHVSMIIDDKYLLKQRVLGFMKSSGFYQASQPLKVVCDKTDRYFILYGTDVENGVSVIGNSADEAYGDFISNWIFFQESISYKLI